MTREFLKPQPGTRVFNITIGATDGSYAGVAHAVDAVAAFKMAHIDCRMISAGGRAGLTGIITDITVHEVAPPDEG